MSLQAGWMSRADRRRWNAARTVSDLATLMAAWLEGTIASQPGHMPGHGPDPETHDLAGALASANRAGYLTVCSQPGAHDTIDGQGVWRQHAAVEGFISSPPLLHRLTQAATAAGIAVIRHTIHDRRGRGGRPVITCDDRTRLTFGDALNARNIRQIFRGCHPAALTAVCSAAQVTLIDPNPGQRGVLWDLLAQVTAPPPMPT
ncbi:DUF6919 domain-containing protein [Streptomyces sp. NPDC059718]